MTTEDPQKAALAQRLAAAQAKIDEIAKRREAREEAQSVADQVDTAERTALADAAFEDAKAEHGEGKLRRIAVRDANEKLLGFVILKAPKQIAWNAFENQLGDAVGTKKDELREKLWRPCLVWPEPAIVDQMISDVPFTRQRLVNAISALAGVRVEEASGK